MGSKIETDLDSLALAIKMENDSFLVDPFCSQDPIPDDRV